MNELAAFHDRVWRWIERPPRLGTLATVKDGAAEARTVMLPWADRATATLRLHADARTSKCDDVDAAPWATLVFWDAAERLQVRLRLHLARRAATAAEWAALGPTARTWYGTDPAPGTPIPHPQAYGRTADPARLAILEGRIDAIDAADLVPAIHIRARFRRGDGWQGEWLAP